MTSGGKRKGSGRPVGSGPFHEKTRLLRIPESKILFVKQYIKNELFSLPLYTCSVSAEFPSPADDDQEGKIDLNEHLIKNPSATFLVKAAGDSMMGAGIYAGDILIVDRSLARGHGNIIIAVLENELTVKRLEKRGHAIYLVAENKKYRPIEVKEEANFSIWGVVTKVLHDV